jgi:hypothetical protein
MAPRTLWRLCLLACFLTIEPDLKTKLCAAAAGKGKADCPIEHVHRAYTSLMSQVPLAGRTPPGPARPRSLSAPIIGRDNRLIACSGKNLLAFEPNGSAAWTVPLGHQCNHRIRPVTDHGEVIDRACSPKTLRPIISVQMTGSVGRAGVSGGRRQDHKGDPTGLLEQCTTGMGGVLQLQRHGGEVRGDHRFCDPWRPFVPVRDHQKQGTFRAIAAREAPQWSLGPLRTWRGYRFGCKTNVSGCYFDSAPVVGLCEGALYVSLHFTITLLFFFFFCLGPCSTS